MKEVQIDVNRCLGCQSCELACAVAHSQSKELFGALLEDTPPRRRIYVQGVGDVSVPVNCRHCEEAMCISVCPTGAMYRDEETGAVLHNRDRCIGCGFCELACPFGAINRLPRSKIVAKCDLCQDRGLPACVEACPTGALVFADADDVQRRKRLKLAQQMTVLRS